MKNLNAERFEVVAVMFYGLTGIDCEYEKQYGNGSYIYFRTDDNDGYGYYIGANGYLDAIDTLLKIMAGYEFAKNETPDSVDDYDAIRSDFGMRCGFNLYYNRNFTGEFRI